MKIFPRKKANPPKKSSLRGFSLTFRLSLGITILITALMAVVGFATFMRDRDALLNETYSRGWSTVRTIQTLATIPLKHQNYRLLNELTTNLARDPFIKESAILDSAGKFIAHSDTEKLSRPEEGKSITEKLAGQEKYTGHLTAGGNPTALTFSAPVQDNAEQILGYVYLAVDLSPIQAHLQDIIHDIVLNFAMACIAGMLLTRLIVMKAVGKPIQSLVNATKKVSTGDFSQQVDINTRDEIGHLGQAFNTMNNQLAILFQSIKSTVSDLIQTNEVVLKQSELPFIDQEANTERQEQIMKEINSAARRLHRITNKLNSLALQYKTQESNPEHSG